MFNNRAYNDRVRTNNIQVLVNIRERTKLMRALITFIYIFDAHECSIVRNSALPPLG